VRVQTGIAHSNAKVANANATAKASIDSTSTHDFDGNEEFMGLHTRPKIYVDKSWVAPIRPVTDWIAGTMGEDSQQSPFVS
jgi:hypothetical protein